MKVQHSFDLPEPFDQAWNLLNRIDEIAPCLPGATASKTAKDHFTGSLRVRMGPLDMTFNGTIDILERDREAGRVVLRSKGSEARGQGTASATTAAKLSRSGSGTHVELDTNLMISGRVAQMGRGMIVEISNDLLDRFVSNLKAERAAAAAMASETAAEAAGVQSTSAASSSSEKAGDQYLSIASVFWRMLKRRIRSLFGSSRSE